MKSATSIQISTFGGLVGLIGIEHGLGEILQGNQVPDGLLFPSWPGSPFFRVLGGEPALTIIPNLLITGILATLVSLIYLVWAILFVQRKHGGLVLIMLTIPMLLVGGGIFPPLLGFLIGVAATRIHTPLAWWRNTLSIGAGHFLGMLWPWFFGACLLAWLSMFPGVPVLSYYFGVENTNLIFILLGCMFGFLLLASISAFARDSQRQVG
ncbi:MAG: hypothetical protein IH586_12915 [Anaerolineaceae bacterium]|nr:hypothetical protein [Anaerolineaceae bacterium]